MFGLLKNKLASFIKGLSGKEEQKAAQAPVEAKPAAIEEKKAEAQPKPAEEKKAVGLEIGPKMEKKEAPKHVEAKSARQPADAKHETKPVHKQSEIKSAQKPVAKPAETKPVAAPPKQEPLPSAPSKPVEAPQKKEEPKKSLIDVIFRKPAVHTTPKAEAPSSVQSQKSHEPPSQQPAAIIPPQAPKPQPAAASPPHKIAPLPDAPAQPERDLSHLERKAYSDKKEIAPKIGIGTTLKSIFSSEITIGESEVADLLSELELSLLEADVAYDVSLEVSSQLKSKLVGMKVPKGKVEENTRQAIQGVLASVMQSDRKFDLVERVRMLPKPAKILFVGPNGAGKTTTMAKIAHMLLQGGFTAVFSASDTFRAAAIEQTEVHAGRLGIKVVKSKYGADPASVAFDAVNFARTHNIDVVLIDSAGRQDTNSNLLDELKKINRVAKPDIKIYIGESISGNSLIDQVKAFDEAIGMDGAILTKIDCDAKGGTALSLTHSTGIPILYLGIGQAYADLIPFEPAKIAHEIMS
jgi:fused signal recognition particle receptor